jgi:hypothetical protein
MRFYSVPRITPQVSESSILRFIIFGLAILVVFCAGILAQPEPKPTNLKVLDSTSTHDQVMLVMRQFTQGLGVGCDYCHARPAAGQREPDFASDDNKIKLTAREMYKMVNQINGTMLANLPATSDTSRVTVQCVTCHHGQPRPLLIQEVLKKELREHGMAAADSTYRELRKEYYGGFTYDFGDQALAGLALEVGAGKVEDGLALVNLNKEFNPQSFVNEWVSGKLLLAKADTAAAVTAFKRSLEINPEFRRAKRELDALGVK